MIFVTVLFLLSAALSLAQQKPKPEKPDYLVDIVTRAAGLPSEFHADALLNLIATGHVHEREWKRELIEEAFYAANGAQLAYQRTAFNVSGDTVVGMQWSANRIDRLTLQFRAVEAMREVEPARAVSLFEEITLPDLPGLPCTELAVPRLEYYYQTATHLATTAFTEQERKEERHLAFLQDRIAAVRSPEAVWPVLRLILAVPMDSAARSRLLASFAGTLARVPSNDRLFGSSEAALIPSKLATTPEAMILMPALRAYIVRNLHAPRCSDHLRASNQPPSSFLDFNKALATLDPDHQQVKPITEEEATATRDDGTYEVPVARRSTRAQEIDQAIRALMWLRDGTNPARLRTAAEKQTSEWRKQYQELRKLIDLWRERDEESREQYFANAGKVYGGVVTSVLPPGQDRDMAMEDYLLFVETRYAVTDNRNFWYTVARSILVAAMMSSDAEERMWMLDRLSRSANPIISVEAMIERLNPTRKTPPGMSTVSGG